MAFTTQIATSDLTNILEKIIAPRIEEQLPDDVVLLRILEKNRYPMANNSFYITIRNQRHTGIAAVREGEKLATGKAGFNQAQISAKFIFGTFDISDQSIETAKGQPGALANILTVNADYLRKDFGREMNRMFWKAQDGVLAIVAASAAGGTTGTMTVLNYQGLTTSSADCAIAPTKYIEVGKTYCMGTSPSGATKVFTVTAKTDTTITWASSGSITPAAGDLIFVADGDSSYADEPMGLQGIVDDGSLTNAGYSGTYIPTSVSTFEGIARSGNAYWQAPMYTTGAQLIEANMISTFLKAREYGNPQFIFTNQKLFARYANILTSYKMAATTKEVMLGGVAGSAEKGGYVTGLEFAAGGVGAVVVLDYDCPDKELYFIDPASIVVGQLADLGWLDQGGGNVLRRTDYASWQGVLKWYGNLACKDVRANAKMSGQTVA